MDYLPGTTIEISGKLNAEEFLNAAFAPGGLVLSQVASLTGLEPHTVQNWVKRGFVPAPTGKKYTCDTFCLIAMINALKDTFPIERISALLQGAATWSERISYSMIYIMFSEAADILPDDVLLQHTDTHGAACSVLRHRSGRNPNDERLAAILDILLLTYVSGRIKKRAQLMLAEI